MILAGNLNLQCDQFMRSSMEKDKFLMPFSTIMFKRTMEWDGAMPFFSILLLPITNHSFFSWKYKNVFHKMPSGYSLINLLGGDQLSKFHRENVHNILN